MITLIQAKALRYGDLVYSTFGAKVVTYRVSGGIKLWKTRPMEFRLPIKFGLYVSSAITHENAGEFFLTFDLAVSSRRALPQGVAQ